ncbi:hypothetical protein VNO80_26085 [Phaseolus coccineus]|uniref:Uncharacterized protein n=1 Tax=Phaseolus coccineus TaxID=3886 RepID=A0AAN9LVU1_PHACN
MKIVLENLGRVVAKGLGRPGPNPNKTFQTSPTSHPPPPPPAAKVFLSARFNYNSAIVLPQLTTAKSFFLFVEDFQEM